MRALIKAGPDTFALVWNRIRASRLNRGDAYPAISFKTVSGNRQHHQKGVSHLVMWTAQVDCWAESINTALTLADNVRREVDLYVGTIAGEVIQKVFVGDPIPEIFHEPDDGSDVGVYQVPVEFDVWYSEAQPALA